MIEKKKFRIKPIVLGILGLFIFAVGLFMLIGGVKLISLGGSWYFAPVGLALVISGVLTALGRAIGAVIYLTVFCITIIWSIWDVGLSFWPLISRLYGMAVIAVPLFLLFAHHPLSVNKSLKGVAYAGAGLTSLALMITTYLAFQPRMIVTANDQEPIPGKAIGAAILSGDWQHYGRTTSGTRFVPLNQITPENVKDLEVAWTYRTGEIPKTGEVHVVTPLHVNGMLYGCTQSSRLFALDPETGKEIWSFNPEAKGNFIPRCRGVGYYADAAQSSDVNQVQQNQTSSPKACTRRIVSTTVDARLVAVDADTGKRCTDFGDQGIVDLKLGMGDIQPGFYFPTSAPLVARNLIIVGGLIRDNHDTDEPSGVVRAFDVHTGKLKWAWDVGNPEMTKLPEAGQHYTRGTPNVWSAMSFDDELGLIYLPTGNATPDFWGGHRSDAAEKYSSSVVALDIETGSERWHFQTVHHDIWDYDVPSQPALYDVPDGKGGTIPALIQTTKQGQIFMLDRRNGQPIADVKELPVPQGGVNDDWTAKTQPFSVGMPAIGTEDLTESRMWGATLLDQLMCRIDFRSARYEGMFTPASEKPTIQYPGWSGGMNWGSVSIAEDRGYLIVNDIRMGVINQLIPRTEYDALSNAGNLHGGNAPQYGTPWGLLQNPFVSPLGIPCQEPPFGTITAIDLSSQKIAWSMPLGTVKDSGPLGVATRLPIPIGMPTLGGPVTTSSGLIFMAGTQDNYIRALDLKTGKELWKGRLPIGANTTPMMYTSAKSDRQFVVISAGGNRSMPERGDYIVAFALPKK